MFEMKGDSAIAIIEENGMFFCFRRNRKNRNAEREYLEYKSYFKLKIFY